MGVVVGPGLEAWSVASSDVPRLVRGRAPGARCGGCSRPRPRSPSPTLSLQVCGDEHSLAGVCRFGVAVRWMFGVLALHVRESIEAQDSAQPVARTWHPCWMCEVALEDTPAPILPGLRTGGALLELVVRGIA